MNTTMRSICYALLLTLSGAGCGDDDPTPEVDAQVSALDAATVDAMAVDAMTLDAAGVGSSCGGFAGVECSPGLTCDFAENDCGGADSLGTCIVSPAGCPDPARFVCGCDGNVYDGQCGAHSAGVDVSVFGGCTPPLDTFLCGFRFCAANTQYCQRQVSDVVGVADDYECVDIPAACASNPDCACLQAEPCGDMCELRPQDGSLLLTCPGG